MTIRKGEPWGEPVDRPADLRVAHSDPAIVQAYLDEPGQPVGLSGGDLYRSLGSPPARSTMQRLPIDLVRVTVDGRSTTAVAHVLMRGSWWRGPLTAVMNIDQLGDWNVAPRAHPNDGRIDVVHVDAAMSIRSRWQARGRLLAGTHVPHPHIAVGTATAREWTFLRPTHLWVDGVRVTDARSIAVEVLPDAFAVLV